MRRIYFLVPDIQITHKIVDELQAKGLEERNIHILAKQGTKLGDLLALNSIEKSDLFPSMERGVSMGGTAGLLAGLIAVAIPGSLVVGGGAVLACTVMGAGVGVWFGVDGVDEGNTRLKPYEEAIEKGELLILLDIPKYQVDEISRLIIKHHPEAEFEGMEPILPPIHDS